MDRRDLLMVLLLSFSGCSQEIGPEPMRVAPVSGRVIVRDRPLSGGWLEFLPVEGTVGRLRSARIGPDGTFRADGVAEGTVAIRIVGAALPPEYATPFGQIYLIRRDVSPGGSADLVIDLDEEYRAMTLDRPG
jgi:hypothetical protein